MINGSVVSTRIGYDIECKFRCAIYLLDETNSIHRIPFSIDRIQDFLTKMDISCWERVVHTALRYDPETKVIKHITRDSAFACES